MRARCDGYYNGNGVARADSFFLERRSIAYCVYGERRETNL